MAKASEEELIKARELLQLFNCSGMRQGLDY